MPLTYEQAERTLRAAMAKAQEMGLRMGISVVDDKGNLVAMGRMTGAGGGTADISLGKAKVAAAYGVASKVISERLPQSITIPLTVMNGGRLVFSQGAVPLKEGDVVVGAVGASGNTPENDELVAEAGAAALSSAR